MIFEFENDVPEGCLEIQHLDAIEESIKSDKSVISKIGEGVSKVLVCLTLAIGETGTKKIHRVNASLKDIDTNVFLFDLQFRFSDDGVIIITYD